MILFINACARKESRTRILAQHLLNRLDAPFTELRLYEQKLPCVDQDFLALRDRLTVEGNFEDPVFAYARQFAAADTIVVAAPYWDLSFPAILKQYYEMVNAVGVTFAYSEQGIPVGLCHAERLYYVTTAGGPMLLEEFGFGYIKALAENFYQIPETILIKAEGLDLQGADVEAIMENAAHETDLLFQKRDRH